MKRLLSLLLILGLSSSTAFALEVDMAAIAMIESSGNPWAIGDGGKALGLYQLHEGVIKDYNRAHNTAYLHQDALGSKAGLIADWYLNEKIPAYLRHYGREDTLENRLTAYNMGIGSVLKGKVAHEYIKKYIRLAGSDADKMVGHG